MYRISQVIDAPQIDSVQEEVVRELECLDLASRITPGARIAVTAGSRGINQIDTIIRQVIDVLKGHGASPFIVPAMGSHGNGTAQGQRDILRSLNITEDTMGVEVLSSMEVVEAAVSSHGFPVLVDKYAAEADGVVVINRVKPHTEFEGHIESGMMKMMAIGLGKHEGCFQVHKQTVNYGYSTIIPEIGGIILDRLPVLFGIGIVENAYDETALIRACLPENLIREEQALLKKAKTYMARLPFDQFDILIVDEIGKNISGTGMDTNVIGRIMFVGEPEPVKPKITRIVALDVTDSAHGNGLGIGLADFTTRRFIDKLDTTAMATNAIAAMTPEKVRLPIALETDRAAVEAAFQTIGAVPPDKARIVHIKNTLEISTLHVSQALTAEVENSKDLVIDKKLGPLAFEDSGRIKKVKL